MSENIKYDTEIDKYLAGLMSKDERKEFETLLSKEESLKNEILIRKSVKRKFEIKNAKSIRERVAKVHSETQNPQTKIRPLTIMKYAAVGLVAMMSLFYGVSQFSGSENSGDPVKQLASFYEPYQLQVSDRGSNTDAFIKALENVYNGGDYKAAYSIIEQLSKSQPEEIKWVFYRGICKMETDDIQGAIVDFEQVKNSDHLLWADHGTWYLALTQLKNNDNAAAKVTLQALANDKDADHHKEAVSLLSKI